MFKQIERRAKWATLDTPDQTKNVGLSAVQARDRVLDEEREIEGKDWRAKNTSRAILRSGRAMNETE